MPVSSKTTIRAFVASGVTVGFRSLIAVVTFFYILRSTSESGVAAYGVLMFIWSISHAFVNNLVAQPLIDQKRLRTIDVSSARSCALLAAASISFLLYISSDYLNLAYPNLVDLDENLNILIWLTPISVLGLVEMALAQRHMQFKQLAYGQSFATLISCTSAILISFENKIIGLIIIQALIPPAYLLYTFRKNTRYRLHFNLQSIAKLSGVGRHLALDGVLAVSVMQGPVVMFGLFLATAELAIFVAISRSIQLIAAQLGRVAALLTTPIIRRVKEHENRLHQTILTTAFISNGLVLLPLIIIICYPHIVLELVEQPVTHISLGVVFSLGIKQALDTVSNTTFSTFRAIDRPDVSWKWSLIICSFWITIAVFGSQFSWNVGRLTHIMAVCGVASVFAIRWLCNTVGLSVKKYFLFVFPVYAAFILTYIMNALYLTLCAEDCSMPDNVPLLGGIVVASLYLILAVAVSRVLQGRNRLLVI